MEKALWYLRTATRGGENRAHIIRALSEKPMNANQLADTLDVRYKTVRHHLDALEDHDVVEPGHEDSRTFRTTLVLGLLGFAVVMLLENAAALYFFLNMRRLYAMDPGVEGFVLFLRGLQFVAIA